MSQDNQSFEEILFDLAVQKPTAEERASFLEIVRRDNPALGAQLAALLEGHFGGAGFLPKLPAGAALPATLPSGPLEESPAQMIGRYKLLEKIGEGGFGEVWMAEQREPVKRRVALKLIKLGMDSRQIVARFEAERQALAMMDHANIARIFDAGTTDSGRPYFVMELVRGIKITEYCDQNNLPTKERLALFIEVCQAVQHAHQKGIIHRDIKPSNILVTLHDGMPVPKVIDFGIAKATQQELTDKTVFTQFQQFIGTPAYISPEQAEMSGLDIDTRADIYSLGVLLYELLVGQTPFDGKEMMQGGLDALRQIIREREPLRPSTKLNTLQGDARTTAGKRRQTDVGKLVHQLEGDLDWIVMKCLEKDRTRRYDTANGLAMDIQRHLNNEPVVARPPSNFYRFQKLVRRNKMEAAALTAVALALLGGLATSTWMFARERHARQQAVESGKRESLAHAGEARAREVAEKRLYDSLVREARALRTARTVGYREEVFKLLQQALNLPGSDPAELRREAVACLGDFVGLTPTTWSDFPKDDYLSVTSLNRTGTVAAFGLTSGTIILREMPSGTNVARLSGRGRTSELCFNTSGDQLLSVHEGVESARAIGKSLAGPETRLWIRDAGGHWDLGEVLPLPGATGCLASSNGLYVVVLDATAQAGKLFDVRTRSFVQTFEWPARANQWTPAVALSPDGRLLATENLSTSDAHTVVLEVKDLLSGAKLRLTDLHSVYIQTLDFSADGKYLICITDSGGAVYQVDGFRLLGAFGGLSFGRSSRASFGFNNTVLAFPDRNQSCIRLWDRIRSQDLAFLMQPSSPRGVHFAPDGSYLLTSGSGEAHLYSMNVGREKVALTGHAGEIGGIAFNPDGTKLASVGRDRVLRLSDAVTGRELWEVGGLAGIGSSVVFGPEGDWVAHGYYDLSTIEIRSVIDGRLLCGFGTNDFEDSYTLAVDRQASAAERATPSHPVGGTGILALDRTGRFLTRVSTTELFQIWKLERSNSASGGVAFENRRLKSLVVPSCATFAASPDGRRLSFIQMDDDGKAASGGVYVWDVEGDAVPRRFVLCNRDQMPFLSFSQDSLHLEVETSGTEVVTFDAETGNRLSSRPAPGTSLLMRNTSQYPTASPDGTRLAMVPSREELAILHPETHRLLYSLPGQNGTVVGLAWSPDSRRLAVARSNGDLSIWGLEEVERILAGLNLRP